MDRRQEAKTSVMIASGGGFLFDDKEIRKKRMCRLWYPIP
jgi:hypothetical protein